MAVIPISLDHFNNGVVSQEVIGRMKSQWYFASLQKCQNGIITPYGTVRKRPGTLYIANINCSRVRFFPFVYNEEQSYALLFCFGYNGNVEDHRIYFFTLDSFVVDDAGNPYYINLPSRIWCDSDDRWDIVRQETVDAVRYVQKEDVMYFFVKGHKPLKLTRIKENNWQIEEVDFELKYIIAYGNGSTPKAECILPATLLEPTKVQLTFTVNGTTTTVVDDGNGNFTNSAIKKATIDYSTGRLYVEANNNFDVDTPIYVEFLNQDSFYPATATFFENRLVVGNLPNNPRVIMGSVVGSYEKFVFGTYDNNAWIYEISSEKNDEIAWITGIGSLFIGTINAEYVATGGSTGITPKSIRIIKQSEYGSAFIQPVIVGNTTIFTQFFKTRLFEFTYNYEIQGYVGRDLNLINRDILQNKVKEIAVEYEPYKRVWCLLEDGKIAQLTYLKSEGVLAWHSFETQGNVKTITSIPAIRDNFTQVYMVVERNGKLYIESTQQPTWDNYFDTVFVDSAVVYSGNETDIINGLPFDDGTVVKVLTEQGVHPDCVVNNNSITLNWKTTYAVVGLGYEYIVRTMPIEIVNDTYNTINRPKALKNVNLYLYNSIGGAVGMNNDYELLWRTPLDNMDELLPLYTGFKHIEMFDQLTTTERIWFDVKCTAPVPFDLVSINFDLVVGANV